jgi:hypothetical protein
MFGKREKEHSQSEKNADGLFGPKFGRVRLPARRAIDVEDASTGGHFYCLFDDGRRFACARA